METRGNDSREKEYLMKKLVLAACVVAAAVSFAESTPVMLSLFTPVQIPSSEYDVTGFRLSLLYGDCKNFKGLDIGVVDHTDGDFTGVQIGGVNVIDDRLLGGQIGLVNWNSSDVREWDKISTGAQIGLLNYAGSFCGLQGGIVNVTGDSFTGMQSGFFNLARDMKGLQCGGACFGLIGVNVVSGSVRGCQIGLLNYAEEMECGLQIGIVNIISRNGWLPVLPIVNGHF